MPKALKWRCNDKLVMRLAENDEFKTYNSISKINSIFKIK